MKVPWSNSPCSAACITATGAKQQRDEAAAEIVARLSRIREHRRPWPRTKLEEQRATLGTEGRQSAQEKPPLRDACFQPRSVRDRLRHLLAKHEAVGCLAGPPLDRGSRRHGVERGVDLNGREEPGIVRQVVARLRPGRIYESRPVGRAERRGAQTQAGRQGREIEVKHAVSIGVATRGVKAAGPAQGPVYVHPDHLWHPLRAGELDKGASVPIILQRLRAKCATLRAPRPNRRSLRSGLLLGHCLIGPTEERPQQLIVVGALPLLQPDAVTKHAEVSNI